MGQGQVDDVLLDVPGQEDCRSRLPPRMGQGAPIAPAQEAIAPKARQISLQLPVDALELTAYHSN